MAGTIGVSFLIGAHLQSSVGSAFASLGSRMNSLRQSFRNFERQSTGLGQVIVKQRELADAMARARAQLRSGGAVDKGLTDTIARLARQYGQAARNAGVYGESLAQITWRHQDMLRRARQTEAQLRNMQTIQAGRDLRSAGRDQRSSAIGKASTLVASMSTLARPLKIGAEFEEGMSKVKAISQATGENLQKLEAQARKLGATTVWSAKEAAEGMSFLAMAGFKTNEIMDAMPGMLSLATAGGMDLGRTADIASNVLSGFGFEAEKMSYVADVMAKTFTNSNTSIETIGETMKYCAPIAAQAGVSFEMLAAMIGKLGDSGMQGSMAGTGVAAIIGRMAKPPKEAFAALGLLNIAIADTAGNMRPFEDVLKEFGQKTANLGSQQKLAYAKMLFGANHWAKGLVLVNSAVNGSMQEMAKGIYEEGYVNNVAGTMANNLAGDLKGLNSVYEDVCITLFNVLKPALRQIVQNVTPLVRAIGVWINENPRLVQGLTILGGAFIALKAAGIAFMFLDSYRKTFAGGLLTLRGRASGVITGITGAFGRLRSELAKPVSLSTQQFNTGMSNMKSRLESLRSSVSRTVASLRQITPASIVAGTAAATSGAMAATGRAGFNALRMGIRGVGMAFKTMFGPMSLMIMGLSFGAEYIMEHWEQIAPYFQALWEGVKNVFSAVLNWMQPIFDKIMAFIEPVLSGIDKAKNLLGSVWDKIVGNDKEKADKEKEAAIAKRNQERQQKGIEEMRQSMTPEERAAFDAELKAEGEAEQTGKPAVSPANASVAPVQAGMAPAQAQVRPPAQMQNKGGKKQQGFEALLKQAASAEDVDDLELGLSGEERAEAIEEAEAYTPEPPRQKKASRKKTSHAGSASEPAQPDLAPLIAQLQQAMAQSAPQAQQPAQPEKQIIQPQVQVQLSVTQNGIPEASFASGVMNAIKSRQGELEQMISAIVNEQARLAYG